MEVGDQRMNLSEFEAIVFENIRNNPAQSMQRIADQLGTTWHMVQKAVKRLMSIGAIQTTGHGKRHTYEVLVETYNVIQLDAPAPEIPDPLNLDTSGIPESIKAYVKSHMPYMSRSKLAQRTGLPKVLVNQLCYELEIAKGRNYYAAKERKASMGVAK